MLKCVDEHIGALLHAYELKTLSDEETERFEIHLLHCEHCFDKVREFEKFSRVILESKTLKTALGESFKGEEKLMSEQNGVWKRLWPEGAWLLKPGLVYILVILLAVPAFYGIREITDKDTALSEKPKIGLTQEIDLKLVRSNNGPKVFSISSGREGVINFVSIGSSEDKACLVTITDDSGNELARFENYNEFDDQGTGRLVIPNNQMKPGDYWLVIRDISADPKSEPARYRFKIIQ